MQPSHVWAMYSMDATREAASSTRGCVHVRMADCRQRMSIKEDIAGTGP